MSKRLAVGLWAAATSIAFVWALTFIDTLSDLPLASFLISAATAFVCAALIGAPFAGRDSWPERAGLGGALSAVAAVPLSGLVALSLPHLTAPGALTFETPGALAGAAGEFLLTLFHVTVATGVILAPVVLAAAIMGYIAGFFFQALFGRRFA